MRTGADGQTRMVLKPTSFQARLLVIEWFESIRLIESNYLPDAPEPNRLQQCRTMSDRPFPQPTDFTVRRISAGAGRLFGSLPPHPSGILDIPALTTLCRPGRSAALRRRAAAARGVGRGGASGARSETRWPEG